MHYFVDGYNFLFRLHQIVPSLEETRNNLIKEINKKIRVLNLKTTIVFDAAYQHDHDTRSHYDNLEIVYTAHGESADDYIISELETIKYPTQVTVVTSDKDLKRRAKSLRARTLTIEEFMSQLNRNPKKEEKGRPSRQPVPIAEKSIGELERYLKIFEERSQHLAQEKPQPSQSEMERWLQIFEQH